MMDLGDNKRMHSDVKTPTEIKSRFRRTTFVVVLLSLLTASSISVANALDPVFSGFPSMTVPISDGKITLVPPTSTSPGSWSYTTDDPTIATVSGGVLTLVGLGITRLTAIQAASGVYTSRVRSASLRVTAGTPTLSGFADRTVQITEKIITLTPPISNSTGTWRYASSNTAIATIADNKVTLLDGGDVTITATQAALPLWTVASKTMKLTIVAITPVIGTFGNITLMKDSVAYVAMVAPTSTSPGAWTFSSSNPAVATVNGNSLTPVGLGTSVITATQAHSGNFGSIKTSMTVTVQAAIPTVGTFPSVSANFSPTSTKSLTLTAPTSNSAGSWSYASSDTTVATVQGAVVTLLKPGTSTMTATQSAAGTYGASTPLTMVLTVVGVPTVGAWSSFEKVIKDSDFALVPPTSTSPSSWTFTSSDIKVIEITGSNAKVVGAGSATITATQVATPIWAGATAQIVIRVLGDIPTVGSLAGIEATTGGVPIAMKAPTSNSSGVWSYASSDKSVVTFNGTSMVIAGAGTATITATQLPAGNFSQSNTVQAKVIIKPNPVVAPTPTPTPQPSTSASATPQPTPSGSPTPKPTISPSSIPKPTTSPTSQLASKPTLKVTAIARVITIASTKPKTKVTIDGVSAKVGSNAVKPGARSVVVSVAGKVVYRKTFSIK